MNTDINPNSVVKLNVGGTMFMTTQGTLLSDQNSMLAKMFSTETNGGRFPGMYCNLLRGISLSHLFFSSTLQKFL